MAFKIKSKHLIFFYIVGGFVLFTNLPIFKNLSGINDSYFRYSNYNGSHTTSEQPDVGYVFTTFYPDGRFILKKPQRLMDKVKSDTIVYRLFDINPLKFWRWAEYAFNWRYRMPYMDWDDVVKRRGFDILEEQQAFNHF